MYLRQSLGLRLVDVRECAVVSHVIASACWDTDSQLKAAVGYFW